MSEEKKGISGFVPGGTECVQWIFEGDDWPGSQVQAIVDLLTPFIQEYRKRYGSDMEDCFTFSYDDEMPNWRVYYMTRSSWRDHGPWGDRDQALSFEVLLLDIQRAIDRSLTYSESFK